jgi:Icc-related predicted phosphoesterase
MAEGNGRLKVAAIGDLHVKEDQAAPYRELFAEIAKAADVLVLTGDLTDLGKPKEAEILAEDLRHCSVPVIAVLGNHDYECGHVDEVREIFRGAGVRLLDGSSCEVEGVGFVGVKGFVGGFAPRHLPDFGEPSLRAVYAEATAEVEALDEGLREVATCPLRIALLHYSPAEETLEGEPREIWVFLGSDRLAAPILEHGPDLVLHGHAHAGSPDGTIGETPVHNVSQPVLGTDFRIFELDASRAHSAIP